MTQSSTTWIQIQFAIIIWGLGRTMDWKDPFGGLHVPITFFDCPMLSGSEDKAELSHISEESCNHNHILFAALLPLQRLSMHSADDLRLDLLMIALATNYEFPHWRLLQDSCVLYIESLHCSDPAHISYWMIHASTDIVLMKTNIKRVLFISDDAWSWARDKSQSLYPFNGHLGWCGRLHSLGVTQPFLMLWLACKERRCSNSGDRTTLHGLFTGHGRTLSAATCMCCFLRPDACDKQHKEHQNAKQLS